MIQNNSELTYPVLSFLSTLQQKYGKNICGIAYELYPSLLFCVQGEDERLSKQCHYLIRRFLLSSPFCARFCMELAQAAQSISNSSPAVSYLIEYLEILESFDDNSVEFGKKAMLQALGFLKNKTDGIEKYQVQEMIKRLKGSHSPFQRQEHRVSQSRWSMWSICLLICLSLCAVLSTILMLWSPSSSSSIPSPNFDNMIPISSNPVEVVNDDPAIEMWFDLNEDNTDSLQDVYTDEVFVDVASTEVTWEEESSRSDMVILITVFLAVLSGYGICRVYLFLLGVDVSSHSLKESSHDKRKAVNPQRTTRRDPVFDRVDMSSVVQNEDSLSGTTNRGYSMRF